MVKGTLDIEWICCVCSRSDPDTSSSSSEASPPRLLPNTSMSSPDASPRRLLVPDTPTATICHTSMSSSDASPRRLLVPDTPTATRFHTSMSSPDASPRRLLVPDTPTATRFHTSMSSPDASPRRLLVPDTPTATRFHTSMSSPDASPRRLLVPDTPTATRFHTPPSSSDASPRRLLIPDTPTVTRFQTPSSPLQSPSPPRPPTPVSSQRPVPVPRLRQPKPPRPPVSTRPVPAPRPPKNPVPVPQPRRPVPPPRLVQQVPATDSVHDIAAVEESLHEMSIHEEEELQFEILSKASRKNKDILVDNRGYTYNLKRSLPNGRDWQCAVRQKSRYCAATVKERNDSFTLGSQQHCHEGAPGVSTAKRITAKVKQDSVGNVFLSAGTIAERVLFSMSSADLPPPSRPKLSYLVRIANRTREKLRPKEPQDCDFEIAHGFIPEGFLQADIKTDDGQRHLLFATAEQLSILADLQTWYIDGTFKVVKSPFAQLFSVHGFLGDEQKQVPLLFVLMSRRQTTDYVKVFSALLDVLPRRSSVQTIVADFEKAAWAAARQTLPGVTIKGCHFHWAQAIWRKVQELGLQTRYCEDLDTYDCIRQILALPFLPETHLPTGVDYIKRFIDDDRLQQLMAYINKNWLESSTFPPSTWNVYRLQTRTNNDCEGWHRRLNHSARDSTPPMYVLIPLLHEEAAKIPLQRQMAREGTLQRLQRKDVRDRQATFNRLWDQFDEGNKSTVELLVAISRICGPPRRL